MTQSPLDATDIFKGRHFDRLIIIQAVRWYVTFKLSYRDVIDLLAERGVSVTHTTVMRWVQRYVPIFEKRWKKYAYPTGSSWRVDETYIKVKGKWAYLYRAVDKQGRTVDFLLSENRDKAAASRFFKKALKENELPAKITLDAYEATHRAIAELKKEEALPVQTEVRTNNYLNNIIEQDHRRIKQRYYPMHGFKQLKIAAVTLSGIELAAKIKKGQFDIAAASQPGAPILQIWLAVLAA